MNFWDVPSGAEEKGKKSEEDSLPCKKLLGVVVFAAKSQKHDLLLSLVDVGWKIRLAVIKTDGRALQDDRRCWTPEFIIRKIGKMG